MNVIGGNIRFNDKDERIRELEAELSTLKALNCHCAESRRHRLIAEGLQKELAEAKQRHEKSDWAREQAEKELSEAKKEIERKETADELVRKITKCGHNVWCLKCITDVTTALSEAEGRGYERGLKSGDYHEGFHEGLNVGKMETQRLKDLLQLTEQARESLATKLLSIEANQNKLEGR